jgi:hypothetical protein
MNIESATAELLKENFEIDEMTTALMFEEGLLSITGCRNFLIKTEYKQKAKSKERIRLRNRLAEKYCISTVLVEKIVLNNT